jgi:5-methylcytosine-specific restriction endonuclease McrA
VKVCTECGIERPLEEFPRKGKYRRSKCKACTREINKAYSRVYRDRYPERVRASWHKWAEGVDRSDYHKAYFQAHREFRKAYSRRRYQERRDEILARNKAWRLANPDKVRARAARNGHIRRARLQGVPYELIDRVQVFESSGGVCYLCGEVLTFEAFHIDHVIPIARGGSHTFDNLKAAHPSCNVRKGARLPTDLSIEGVAYAV